MITAYNSVTSEFIEEYNALSIEEPFRFFYLENALNQLSFNSDPLQYSIVLKEKDCTILVLWIDNSIMLYGKNWTRSDLDVLIVKIGLSNLPIPFIFIGTETLINEVLAIEDIKTKTVKNRIFYKIIRNSYLEFKSDHLIESPTENDLHELALMFQMYHQEEYSGTRNKPIEKMIADAIQVIDTGDIIIHRDGNTIAGFCTSMNVYDDKAMIGIVYVRTTNRGQQIGKALTNAILKKTLSSSEECYTMTTKEQTASNIIMLDLGFKVVYEHTNKVTI